MIFTAFSFYGLFTAYLLYEELMSIRLYDIHISYLNLCLNQVVVYFLQISEDIKNH